MPSFTHSTTKSSSSVPSHHSSSRAHLPVHHHELPADDNCNKPLPPVYQPPLSAPEITNSTYKFPSPFSRTDSFTSEAKLNPAPSRFRVARDVVGSFWLWEVASCLFSFACLAAIVAVLLYEDGRQLDQWNLIIPPTAVVSFLGTMAKSSFLLAVTDLISQLKWVHFHGAPKKLSDINLFDEASRGPLGSLKLLFRRHRHSLLGSCAAIVTLAALLVDPFVQLVFSFPSQSVVEPSIAATFQRAAMYDPNHNVVDAGGMSAQASAVGTAMQAAMLQGLMNQTIQQAMVCPSGNCTWSKIVTLGVCGSCTDITSQLARPSCTLAEDSLANTCNITMPSGVSLSVSANSIAGGEFWTRWNASALGNGAIDRMAVQVEAVLDIFEAIQLVGPLESIRTLPPVRGWHCQLQLCTKSYANITVSGSVPSVSIPVEEPLYIQNYTDQSIQGDKQSGYAWANLTTYEHLNSTSPTEYTINVADYTSTYMYLQQMFSMGWYSDSVSSELLNLSAFPGLASQIGSIPPATAPVGRELANSADLNATIRTLADSMTESIRTGANSSSVRGEAYVSKTFIRVQWAWLALPLALMACTCVLLVLAAQQTHAAGLPAWKGDNLSLLFYGLEGYMVPQVPRGAGPQDLERIARDMRASLSAQGRMAFITFS